MKEVFSDEAFVKGLFELDSAAEVQAALKEKGVELTEEEEILGIRELLVKVANGEIAAEQLEQWAAQAESGELPEELLAALQAQMAMQNQANSITVAGEMADDPVSFSAVPPQPVVMQPAVRLTPKVGANEPCPCGSGKKYKKCCGK